MPIPRGGAPGSWGARAPKRRSRRNLRNRPRRRARARAEQQGFRVRLADGEEISASRAVIATSRRRALRPAARRSRGVPYPLSLRALRRCIHFACQAAALGGRRPLGQTAIVHLTPGLDGVSRAVNECRARPAPRRGDRRVGQTPDDGPHESTRGWRVCSGASSRSCPGTQGLRGGRAHAGAAPGPEGLREHYADRIPARIARHVPNLEVRRCAGRATSRPPTPVRRT